MDRRNYLTTFGATSAVLLSGCSTLMGATGDQGNGSSSSSDSSSSDSSSDTTPTPTSEPSPIENIEYEGKKMIVSLRPNSRPQLVEFLDPNGEHIAQETVNSATEVSFLLVGTRTNDPCESIHDPGEYTIAVDYQSGETYRESVTLEPDVSISNITAPSSLSSYEEFQADGKTQYRGSLVIKFTNNGSLPACISRTQVLGKDVPVPRTGKEGDENNTALYGGDGAGLDWYATDDDPTNHVSEHVAVWIGQQQYLTTYIPFVIPETEYSVEMPKDEAKGKVSNEYANKQLNAVLAVETSSGQQLGLPFTFLLSGDVTLISRLFGGNVYAFDNLQIAFDPQDAFDAGTVSNISSMANNTSAKASIPTVSEDAAENATSNDTSGTITPSGTIIDDS